MDKQRILDAILAELKRELATVEAALQVARENATGPESKPEGEFDTRALEAAYLAEGQGRLASELRESIATFAALPLRPWGEQEPIALGAALELETGGTRSLYFLGPRHGGLEVKVDGREVMLITPAAPLGRSLLGHSAGDTLPPGTPGAPRGARVVAVR
jgi:transcription elongation GreA/GreB family factor